MWEYFAGATWFNSFVIFFWSLRFRQFGVCQVNTAKSSTLLHCCLLNRWAQFSIKIFAHFWDNVIFVLGFFLPHPVYLLILLVYPGLWNGLCRVPRWVSTKSYFFLQKLALRSLWLLKAQWTTHKPRFLLYLLYCRCTLVYLYYF